MDPPRSEEPLDYAVLAGYLEALANPTRLELLHILREPRLVSDIELRGRARGGFRAERPISSQAVRKHLARLESAGMVRAQRARAGGGGAERHVVDHRMLFAIGEELRRVTRLRPTVSLPAEATMTGRTPRGAARNAGARLIMVYGPHLGTTYALERKAMEEGRGWVIGRRAGLPVCLDHDPFVSMEHAEVLPRAGFELLDLRSNKNGTELNWEQLPRGGSASLRNGDVVGLGRTLLLFRSD
ncbi:MAG: helix-turn-helix domain-containing protein [Halobacteriales archaeon]|nr:helix-turn-helix domain-containing protein [Halobacteriales archaeon]